MTDTEHPEGFGDEGEPAASPYAWTDFADEKIFNPGLAKAVLDEINLKRPKYEPRHVLDIDDPTTYSYIGEPLFSAIASRRRDTQAGGMKNNVDLHMPDSLSVDVMTGPNVPFILLRLKAQDGGNLLRRPILKNLE